MLRKYIEKFETEHFSLGSFDYYREESEKLIVARTGMSKEEVDFYLDRSGKLPGSYRATILDKTGNYVGYIALYDIKDDRGLTSVRMETNRVLTEEEKKEINYVYKNWLFNSLDLNAVNEEEHFVSGARTFYNNATIPMPNIVIANEALEEGVSQETIDYFKQFHDIPKRLTKAFTIKASGRAIGIIGLTNFQWPNKRANLQLFLDENLGDEIIDAVSGKIIDDYLAYIHKLNVHNVTLTVPGNDKEMIEIINNSKMNYYGTIPYGAYHNDMVTSGIMYQDTPDMVKQHGIYITENVSKPFSFFDTEKKEMDPVIKYNNGYKLISPKILGSDIDKAIEGQARALQNVDGYAIPLGDYKYIIQIGNEKFGVTNAVLNYDYVLFDENNEFAGYINILRNNANNKNAEIELAITPEVQGRGLGRMILESFYNQLFSIGYASVTSSIFVFNTNSIILHEHVGCVLNGTRVESYFINGRPWDMNIYTKVNSIVLPKEQETIGFKK